MNGHRFLASELPPCTPEKALFHIIPVPFESTVTFGGGTAKGPEAIIESSHHLEAFEGGSIPGDLGIYTWPAVDVEGDTEVVLRRIEQATNKALDVGGMPVVLGGEHTVTYGPLAALKKRYGTFGLIQIDAHADLRDTYDDTPWSHASVMARAVRDLGLPLVQLGVRALCTEEIETRKTFGVTAYDADILARMTNQEVRNVNIIPADFPKNIYITFDVDGLDPSVIPATGTPVPGGLDWYAALDLCATAMRNRNVLGFDVVELAPTVDSHGSDFATAKLVYALMGLVQRESCLSKR